MKKYLTKNVTVFLLITLSLLCIVFATLLGYRLVHSIRANPPAPPRQTDVRFIQSWMTIRHIARVYQVPSEIIYNDLHISEEKYHNKNLAQIAKAEHVDINVLIKQIQLSITTFQTAHPTPPVPPTQPTP